MKVSQHLQIVNYGFIKGKGDEIEYQENTLNDMGLSAMLKKIYMNFKVCINLVIYEVDLNFLESFLMELLRVLLREVL